MTDITLKTLGTVPWRCYAKQGARLCSCTILSKGCVIARSSCIQNATGDIKVFTGALSTGDEADQIVNASVLSSTEPPPEGVVALRLRWPLEMNNRVKQ